MSETKFNHHRAAVFPLLMLLLASGAAAALVLLRAGLRGHWRYLSLLWNLLLAWVPLVCALGVCRQYRAGRTGWRLWSRVAAWLLFFPNAPYIFTDLTHLNAWFRGHFWGDLTMILLVALTGFLLGFLSLFLMQAVVADAFGRVASWLFILVVAPLGGLGVYLGRFLRWNSWDIVAHPLGVTHDITQLAVHPLVNAGPLRFQAVFAFFLLFSYLMLYALTHLPPAQPVRTAAA